ncbi:hypothetical protein ACFSCW_06625 [Sphingomonas tabacisoli]|uniref:Uncharacterized protein n=1 Tax=Sphingomonas tabacisoli TaxID=2249466 RepID=A0ABW4I0N3_9SPHN
MSIHETARPTEIKPSIKYCQVVEQSLMLDHNGAEKSDSNSSALPGAD